MASYNHKKIEKKWQKEWEKSGIYKAPDEKKGAENFYALVEFPYPSGNLHTGHWYAFSVPDIFARKKRMEGKNVLFPIGFDAFGLPAENAAIKRKINPKKWTDENINYMRKQIRSMGASFDWAREVITADPEYYKWTQWIFLQFFKKGLAYQAETPVNWCPKDKTVLANEQVASGKCERCGAEIEQKQMRQWMLRITDYAERLLSGLDGLNWKEEIKEAQRNWIGKSEGAIINFEINGGVAPSYVLLHGYTGSPNANFFPWLKKTLENKGAKVYAPKLPNTDDPRAYDQVAEVLKSIPFDKDTVLVGHSFGGVVALKILEQLKKSIKKTVLVTSFTQNHFLDEPFGTHAFDWQFNIEKIKCNAGQIDILRDTTDNAVPQYQAENIKKMFGGTIFDFVATEPHACGKMEPEILKHCIDSVQIFTTRPDTLFGATYLVLASEHELIGELKSKIKNWNEVEKYTGEAKKKTQLQRQKEEKEKTGVELKGIKAINPANNEAIPIWVADHVLSGYGTGAIMAVPAHDERDFEFAKKFGLPIRPVILKQSDSSKSYVMGASEDSMRSFGATIVEKTKDGFFKVLIPFEKIEKYKALIRKHMQANYWNEFSLPNTFYFIFKHKDGRIEEMELNEKTNNLIDKYGMIFNDKEPHVVPQNVYGWLAENSFYKDLLIHANQGILINSGKFSGMNSEKSKTEITKFVGGKMVTQYKLRDWVVSRQRYWGVPIPVIHCPKCGVQAVLDKDLPVKLPEIKDYLPSGEGKSPLAKAEKWLKVKCPKCKGPAERETDTLDTFVDSSWYFLRYCDPKNKKTFADDKKNGSWMPVDLYSGGAEHTTMHLLYSRFWYKAMYDCGLIPKKTGNEPYKERKNRGIILGPDGQKMSKSKGNVIDPDEYVAKLGADTVRMYLAFIGPYNEVGSFPWDPHGILGIKRFLDRVWWLAQKLPKAGVFQDFSQRDGARLSNSPADEYAGLEKSSAEAILRALHKTIKQVGENIDEFKFNTAISSLMIFLNEMEKRPYAISHTPYGLRHTAYGDFLKILAPFAPHIAEEIWARFGHKTSIHLEPWPEYDSKLIEENTFELIIQINGKVRDKFEAPINISQAEAERLTLAREKVKLALENKKPRRVVFVPKRLINIVV